MRANRAKRSTRNRSTICNVRVAEYGVLVPVIVRRRGDDFELIAGERRWRASAALHRATIPALVRQSDDRVALELAMIENLQREDLNPLEKPPVFSDLVDEHGLTQDEVAQRLGKSRPAVANALRLLTCRMRSKRWLQVENFRPGTRARCWRRRPKRAYGWPNGRCATV